MSSAVPPEYLDAPDGGHPASTPADGGPSTRTIWFALAGAALPYATVVLGWWIAGLRFRNYDEMTWETASDFVYPAIAASVAIGILLTVPLLRRIRNAGHLLLALFIGIAYLFGLGVVHFIAYVKWGGPFP
jgi:hypothetical protein